MDESRIHDALGKKEHKPTHTHGMRIERGASGGHVVHTQKHFGKGPHSEGHSHEEGPHAVPDNKALHAMIDEHMGDQPEAGEMPEQAPAAGAEGAGDAAAGAGAAPPAAAGL